VTVLQKNGRRGFCKNTPPPLCRPRASLSRSPPFPFPAAPSRHSGHSVNRNRSVRFFGYSVNSVTSEPRTDRFLRELGTEAFRFQVIRFGFGSNRKEPKFSKHKKQHIQMQISTTFHLFFMHPRDNLRSNKHKSSTTHICVKF
jgi:hypothetical protein